MLQALRNIDEGEELFSSYFTLIATNHNWTIVHGAFIENIFRKHVTSQHIREKNFVKHVQIPSFTSTIFNISNEDAFINSAVNVSGSQSELSFIYGE